MNEEFKNKKMLQVPEINVLSTDTANKIAAGEVIERPAAAVKELLENSLDARATKIDIEFANGGKTLIRVSDNGFGMRKDQLLTCIKPHATSKIKSADDLDNIASFGFRGEALPSIASVSKFKISSKTEACLVGAQLPVKAGHVGEIKEIAMPRGTEITVEDLFCSVPARRKFLKSDNTEASHIIKICKLYALAKKNVEFTLKENGRTVFKSKKTDNLIERIGLVFGTEISSKLMELEPYEAFGIKVGGAISVPSENWASSRNIFAFINGRPVECRAIFSALKEAYQSSMPAGRYPAAFLFIEISPRLVDVNVHPAKREVRLKNEFAMRSAILASAISAIENFAALKSPKAPAAILPAPEKNFEESERLKEILAQNKAGCPPLSSPAAFKSKTGFDAEITLPESGEKDAQIKASAKSAAEFLKIKSAANFAPGGEGLKEPPPAQGSAMEGRDMPAPQPPPRPSHALGWTYLKHFQKKFALFETQSESLIILSIPSAYKRINYERIVRNLAGEKPKSQTLLIPVNIEFDRADDEIFSKNIKAFKSCGFEIEEFGERFYRIGAAPLWVEFGDIEAFIKDFVELAKEEGRALKSKDLPAKAFAKTAAEMSRGARIVESEYAACALLDELFQCKNPMFTPEGRRVCKEFTGAEIRAFF